MPKIRAADVSIGKVVVMSCQSNKAGLHTALTLVEMVIAMAIMSIVFAAVLPQFRAIQNSWNSQQGAAETLQNGRVLMDHFYRNLSRAVRITAVSDSAESNGYIEFEDNDGNNLRYDIGANSYVEFGTVGSLSDLAGPTTQLQFTCYDACDLDTPLTDVNNIRSVKYQATLANSSALGADKTFIGHAYLRANALPGPTIITKGTPYEFDATIGTSAALAQIDDSHYLCAYTGHNSDGWAVVLTVNTSNWTISKETPFEFDDQEGQSSALAKIDDSHYLCAYAGENSDGWAVVLTVNLSNWTISKGAAFEFDNQNGQYPALAKIDDNHYLCAYTGTNSNGWAVVLTVDTGDWTISEETPFEFDNQDGWTPALEKIDDSHYLCAYTGPDWDGWTAVLAVNTSNWTISKQTPYQFNTWFGGSPALIKIDDSHYLCAYTDFVLDGRAEVWSVNTSTWTVSEETSFEFESWGGISPALAKIDGSDYLCAYTGPWLDGWAVILTVHAGSWAIIKKTSFEFDSGIAGEPALAKCDDSHYLCAYSRYWDGWAVVLQLDEDIRP